MADAQAAPAASDTPEAFVADAEALLLRLGATEAGFAAVAERLRRLAAEPSILDRTDLAGLHGAASATILCERWRQRADAGLLPGQGADPGPQPQFMGRRLCGPGHRPVPALDARGRWRRRGTRAPAACRRAHSACRRGDLVPRAAPRYPQPAGNRRARLGIGLFR